MTASGLPFGLPRPPARRGEEMVRLGIALCASALLAAGCGAHEGDDTDAPAAPAGPTVAQVGDDVVTAAEVEKLLDEGKRSFRARGRAFPPPGDPYYADLRDDAVRYLVESRLREQVAARLGVEAKGRAVDFETYRAVVRTRRPGETVREAFARWRGVLEERFERVVYAPGFRPAARRRSRVPPELRDLPVPRASCDLPDGMYRYLVARAHGCLDADYEQALTAEDLPPCPEIPVGWDGGFTDAEVASGYADYVAGSGREIGFFEPLTTNVDDLALRARSEGPECAAFPIENLVSVGDAGIGSRPALRNGN